MTHKGSEPTTREPQVLSSLDKVWQPHSLKESEWPEIDRQLFIKGCTQETPFDGAAHGATLRHASITKLKKGYGIWLNFIADNGWLIKSEHPAERVTRERLKAYFDAMRALGLRPYTVLGRFIDLRMMMKVIAPDHDTKFILRPNGVTIRSMLLPQTRALMIPDSKVLFDWGIDLMQRAKLKSDRRLAAVQFRDGLIIAMLAARGRRLRSMALLKIGEELTRNGQGFRVELKPWQVKTNKHDAFNLPQSLTPYMDAYLNSHRPVLLRDQTSTNLWISLKGKLLAEKGLQMMVNVRSKKRFGEAFGPHRFRHAIATTAPLRDPANPSIGASVLAGSVAVIEQHYNRANQVQAVKMLERAIATIQDTSL